MAQRFRILPACLIALIAVAPSADSAEIVGQGDILFYLDTAAFLGRDGHAVQEVFVRLPNSELKFVRSGQKFTSRIMISVLIVNSKGVPVIEDASEMLLHETDVKKTKTPLFFQTVIKRYQLEPGAYDLSYRVEDLEAQKVSISGLVSRKNKESIVRRLRLNVPRFMPGEASFSQAKFVWDVEQFGDHVEYHPNPTRLYGLYKDSVMVYMELYLPDEMSSAPTFEFRSEVVNDTSAVVASRRIELSNPGTKYGDGSLRAYPVLIREDLTRFPAGTYSLYVSFGLDGNLLRRVRCGTFSIAWDIRTWEVPRREYLAEARFLLGDTEFDEFRFLDLGDQEKMLENLWNGLDPEPELAGNRAYESFLARLSYVNERYAEEGYAVFSARGQIYMRYGPPDEIVEDVIPINRETVQEAIETVGDRYHSFNFASHSIKPGVSVPSDNLTDPRNLGGERQGDHQAYPFELWIYETAGEPILERDRTTEMDMGMRYLFTDRFGYGRYKLESSSSISNK